MRGASCTSLLSANVQAHRLLSLPHFVPRRAEAGSALRPGVNLLRENQALLGAAAAALAVYTVGAPRRCDTTAQVLLLEVCVWNQPAGRLRSFAAGRALSAMRAQHIRLAYCAPAAAASHRQRWGRQARAPRR